MGACCSWFFNHGSGNIHRAAEFGDLGKVRQFLQEGVSVDSRDWSGETPLHKAVKSFMIGNELLEVINFLINRNCDLNARNWKGLTPVAQAAFYERRDIIVLLLQRGANVNCPVSKHNWTLLHEACLFGWVDVALSIVAREDADLNVAYVKFITPLMICVRAQYIFGVEKKEIASILIQNGADVNKSDKQKRTALHQASIEGNIEMVELLLGVNSLNINLQDNRGHTALHLSARRGNSEVVKLLVGVDSLNINIQDEIGKTALHLASSGGNNEMVKLLLEVDSLNMNLQDNLGKTALHLACQMGHREVIKELLKAGADTTIRNKEESLALSIGLREKTLNIEDIKLFVKHGFFFEDHGHEWKLLKRTLKDNFLKDVDFCTQAIVNKYNYQSLPALNQNPNVARLLPAMKKINLKPQQIRQVFNFVKSDIETNKYCNVVKAWPLVLQMLASNV